MILEEIVEAAQREGVVLDHDAKRWVEVGDWKDAFLDVIGLADAQDVRLSAALVQEIRTGFSALHMGESLRSAVQPYLDRVIKNATSSAA